MQTTLECGVRAVCWGTESQGEGGTKGGQKLNKGQLEGYIGGIQKGLRS